MSSVLSDKHFHYERAAYAYIEARLWPDGPICPHCSNADQTRIIKMAGKSTRIGAHNCRECRKPFTVKVGTVFESSHVPLRLWLQAIHLLCSSKKGVSSNQLHRTLGVTLKTAWFMSHRLREAMRVVGVEPMGSEGTSVESDETFFGRVKGATVKQGSQRHKHAILTLIDRKTKQSRSFHLDNATSADIAPIVRVHIAKEARLMTDQATYYDKLGKEFAAMKRSITARKNMCAAMFIPTLPKRISRSLSAA
jgi:transposase-like protein